MSSNVADKSEPIFDNPEAKKMNQNAINCVVVGDGAAGKTSLLTVYANGEFPEDYVPTVCENYSTELTVADREFILTLWDTAGQEAYDRLRPLSYHNAHVIVICYDVTRYDSYENVPVKWVPEVKHFCPNVPMVLVACKTDLRHSSTNKKQTYIEEAEKTKSFKHKTRIVTLAEGERLAKNIQASAFIETSAKLNENVSTVFITAVELVLKAAKNKKKSKVRCSIF